MDPARSESPASEALTGPERDARIEQLLLTGLDRYFAGDYDQAINLWTRVLFLDRHHDRARAYIDRARSAQAERLRESEALLHQGIEALTNGQVDRARELVASALERGASRDLALGVLDRIERLGAPAPARPAASNTGTRSARGSWLTARPSSDDVVVSSSTATPGRVAPLSGRAALWLALGAVAAIAVAIWVVTLSNAGATLLGKPVTQSPIVVAPPPLPLPSASELYVSRARSLFYSGRLRDALRQLDRVPIGDAARSEADHLRADIQRELLAVAVADPRPTHEVP